MPTTITSNVPALRECSLEELRKEPWRLQIQAENAAEQLRNLVLKNYHLFIQSNQCSAIVKDDLLQLKDETDAVVAFLPELKTYCANFQRDVTSVVAKHGDIQFVFEHYLQLTELLDIPQLLEACIHNELYDSALDVIQFAHETFATRNSSNDHAPPNFVITALVQEVAQMARLMRAQLLLKLRDELPLAFCVRVVSSLRRLDALVAAQQQQHERADAAATTTTAAAAAPGSVAYERQLKDEFLSCRSAWLASLSQSVISTADPYQFLIELIDVKRTSWFDLITQYSAIFGHETVDGKVDPPLCRWATTTVADFLYILETQLPKIDDCSSLAAIFEQSLFFGGSLGRVGVDFRALVVVHFEDHVLSLVTHQWDDATHAFHDHLAAHALQSSSATPASASFAKTPIVVASYRPVATSNSNGTSASSSEDYAPPHALMAFPLLAEWTNAMLTTLNELRLCAIASLQMRLATALRATLHALVQTLVQFWDDNSLQAAAAAVDAVAQQPNGTSSNKRHVLADSLQRTAEIFHRDLVPFVVRCFHRLYPNTALSTTVLDPAQFAPLLLDRGLLRLSVAASDRA